MATNALSEARVIRIPLADFRLHAKCESTRIEAYAHAHIYVYTYIYEGEHPVPTQLLFHVPFVRFLSFSLIFTLSLRSRRVRERRGRVANRSAGEFTTAHTCARVRARARTLYVHTCESYRGTSIRNGKREETGESRTAGEAESVGVGQSRRAAAATTADVAVVSCVSRFRISRHNIHVERRPLHATLSSYLAGATTTRGKNVVASEPTADRRVFGNSMQFACYAPPEIPSDNAKERQGSAKKKKRNPSDWREEVVAVRDYFSRTLRRARFSPLSLSLPLPFLFLLLLHVVFLFSLVLRPMSPFNPLRDLVHCSELSLPPSLCLSLPPVSLSLSRSLSVAERKTRGRPEIARTTARPVIFDRRTDYVPSRRRRRRCQARESVSGSVVSRYVTGPRRSDTEEREKASSGVREGSDLSRRAATWRRYERNRRCPIEYIYIYVYIYIYMYIYIYIIYMYLYTLCVDALSSFGLQLQLPIGLPVADFLCGFRATCPTVETERIPENRGRKSR